MQRCSTKRPTICAGAQTPHRHPIQPYSSNQSPMGIQASNESAFAQIARQDAELGIFSGRSRMASITVYVNINAVALFEAFDQRLRRVMLELIRPRKFENNLDMIRDIQITIANLAFIEKIKAANRNQNSEWVKSLSQELRALKFQSEITSVKL